MGLSPEEYSKLTPCQFSIKYFGYIKGEVLKKKDLRLLLWTIVKGYADPKALPSAIEQWWPIGNDEKESLKAYTANPSEWSDEKRMQAEELIKKMTGG